MRKRWPTLMTCAPPAVLGWRTGLNGRYGNPLFAVRAVYRLMQGRQ